MLQTLTYVGGKKSVFLNIPMFCPYRACTQKAAPSLNFPEKTTIQKKKCLAHEFGRDLDQIPDG